MLGNYLKIAIAVLLRRKFLTFVNLFGATLTLTVLVVAYAVFDSTVRPGGAQHRQDNILLVNRLRLTNTQFDRNWGAFIGPAFYERYIATLETPDRISYMTLPNSATSYLDGRKLTSMLRRTDAEYWEILDFDVIEGRVLSADDVELGRMVAVINVATADSRFPDEPAIGRKLVVGRESFEVVGVVANEPETSRLAFADIWVPITTAPRRADAWLGEGQVMLYLEDPGRMQLAKDEYQTAVAAFEPVSEPAVFDAATSRAWTALELYAAQMVAPYLEEDIFASTDLIGEFIAAAIVVALLFMALPAVNMANLSIGRILERAPEIGLRKAAGASTSVLIGQFIFENVVLCAFGGLLAFALAPIVLGILNDTVYTYGRLSMSIPVFAAGFAFVVIFGVISGAYPAWKMARLQPAACLRGLNHA
ncbi:MAG TPA: ABC transporter permease [Gammaproteobacteria bacterium]|nr:ABC transporter permease [Gammaproteobacteria bacterium]